MRRVVWEAVAIYLLGLAAPTLAAAQAPVEPGDPPPLQALLDSAAKENRLVVAEFYARWCGPCRRMAAEVFPRADVQAALAPFVFARYDAENGNGVAAAERYGVDGYPTLVVAFHDGTVLARVVGGIDADDLIALLKQVGDPDDIKAYLDARRALDDPHNPSDVAIARFLVGYLRARPGGAHASQAIDDFRLLPDAVRPTDLNTLLEQTRIELVRKRAVAQLNGLAYTAIGLGFIDAGLDFARSAAALAPGNPEVSDTLAEAYYQAGARARAVAIERHLCDEHDAAVFEDDLARYESGERGLPDGSLPPPQPLWDE